MKKWTIRFRVISPSDYHTPLCHLPIEETCVNANTADEAWEKLISAPYGMPREYYKKEDIDG